MKTLSSHLSATLAMLLSVSAATADSHAWFGDGSQASEAVQSAQPHNLMWAVLPWFAQLVETPPSVVLREAPTVDPPVREKPVRDAPTWTPVEEVEEHVRGGLALVSYLVSR